MYKKLVLLLILLPAVLLGCERSLYGDGTIYLWNDTDEAVQVKVSGRSELSVTLPPGQGKLARDLIAGPYIITQDAKELPGIELVQNQMVVVNIDGVGCLVRADLAGMYKKGRHRIRVLQTYRDEEVIVIPDLIAVPPGHYLPTSAPSRAEVFQRLTTVNCELLNGKSDENNRIIEHLKTLR